MQDKTLILYCVNDFLNPNFRNFLNLAKNTDTYTFVCIYNNTLPGVMPSDIPFSIYCTQKDKGFDFGAYSKFLFDHIKFLKCFKYFLFINSNVQLCIPSYVKDWVSLFTSQIDEKKGNMLGGASINCADVSGTINPCKFSHVMADIFCLNLQGVLTLIMEGIFSLSLSTSQYDRVVNKEIKMSRLFIEKYGWNITCLMKIYEGYDFRNIKNDDNRMFLGDIQYENSYFNTNISPYEILAIKTDRNFNKRWLNLYSTKNSYQKV